MIKILNHHTYRNCGTKLLVIWDNGDVECCDIVNLIKNDCQDLVNSYFKNIPQNNKMTNYSDKDSYSCPLDHDVFNISITYKEEPNHLHWIGNGNME